MILYTRTHVCQKNMDPRSSFGFIKAEFSPSGFHSQTSLPLVLHDPLHSLPRFYHDALKCTTPAGIGSSGVAGTAYTV